MASLAFTRQDRAALVWPPVDRRSHIKVSKAAASPKKWRRRGESMLSTKAYYSISYSLFVVQVINLGLQLQKLLTNPELLLL